MALVSYSDSEGSDAETPTPQPPASKATDPAPASSASAKSGFQKVVDRSNPHKIRVSLPTSAAESDRAKADGDFADSDRPAKRAKTGTAFSGFNSILPAPKNPPKTGGGNTGGAGSKMPGAVRGGGVGRGISLKTGAAPSFSREPVQASEYGYEDEVEDGNQHSSTADAAPSEQRAHDPVVQDEVKLVGKPMMFKPLSVARKPAKKKTAPLPAADPYPTPAAAKRQPSSEAAIVTKQEAPPPEVKKSLFSSYSDDVVAIDTFKSEADEPAQQEIPLPDSYQAAPAPNQHLQQAPVPPTAQPNQLQALAENLGLSAAERRQLFGRSGVTQDARVANFSLAAEYSSNRTLIENEANAMPVHNPVRGIAPGKHSLQQLVNAAANQKDALEESFATGRRNKKEGGGKYGW